MMNRKVIAIGTLKGTNVIGRFVEICNEGEVERYIKKAHNRFSESRKVRISVYGWDEGKRDWVLKAKVQ